MNPGGFGFPNRRGSGVADAVRFGVSQVLTSLQRLTALGNIGALSYADAQSLTGADIKRAADNLALADTLGRNAIINGNFNIWQRGTSSTASGYNTADRWVQVHSGGTVTTSRQAFAITDVLGSGITPQFYLRQTVSGQSAAGDYGSIAQRVEDVRTYSGQQVTLSFWARRSSGSGNMAVEFLQNFGTGGSPSAERGAIGVSTIALTAAWARYATTATITSIAGQTLGSNNDHYLGVRFWTSAGSTLNGSTNSLGIQTIGVDLWGIMLNRGPTALEYIERPNTVEEILCRRYYRTLTGLAGGANAPSGGVGFPSHHAFAPPMRVAPTAVLGSFSTVNTTVSVSSTGIEHFVLQNIATAAGAMAWSATTPTTLSAEL